MTRKYNIVIFGASGFTGKHVILEIAKTLQAAPDDEQFTWAVAGRTASKLEAVLQEMSKEIGKDLSHVEKIVADVSNPDSLRVMARQCDVVLNCAGPYLLWGEVVVQACIEEGTHHLDLSGEAQFLEKIQLKYNKSAEDSGSYIIGATGFDSIPTDVGAIYLEQNFDGELNSVESYLKFHKGSKAPKINYGTYHSALLMCNRFSELLTLKRQLYPNPYFKFQHKISMKPLQYIADVKSWCVFLPFPDTRVMERTQRYKFYQEKRRPAQTKAYMQLPNIFLAILMLIGSLLLGIFTQFKWSLRLLKKYPRLFTLGMVTREGPSREEMDQRFTFTLIGKGWDKASGAISGQHSTSPNKKVVLKVQGKNPGYGSTVTCMLQAGLTIIKERGKMPSKGGVYTPGIAFARTNLVNRLNSHGVTFTLEK